MAINSINFKKIEGANIKLAELYIDVVKSGTKEKTEKGIKNGLEKEYRTVLTYLGFKAENLHFVIFLLLVPGKQVQSSGILLRTLFETWAYTLWIKKDKKRAKTYNQFMKDFIEMTDLLSSRKSRKVKAQKWAKEDMRSILKDIRRSYWYGTYVLLSNYTHASIGSFIHILWKKEKDIRKLLSLFNIIWSFEVLKEFRSLFVLNENIEDRFDEMETLVDGIMKKINSK